MSGEDEAPPPKLFVASFWIALASGLLFVLAGAAVGLLGPAWLARHKAFAAPPAALTAPNTRGKGAAPNIRNP